MTIITSLLLPRLRVQTWTLLSLVLLLMSMGIAYAGQYVETENFVYLQVSSFFGDNQGCARDFQKTKISNLEYRISEILKNRKSRISNLGDFEKTQNLEYRISNIRDFLKSRKNLENIILDSKRKYEKSDFLFEFLNFILLLFLL